MTNHIEANTDDNSGQSVIVIGIIVAVLVVAILVGAFFLWSRMWFTLLLAKIVMIKL